MQSCAFGSLRARQLGAARAPEPSVPRGEWLLALKGWGQVVRENVAQP